MRRLWPTGGLWRHGDFLKLWAGETISMFGSQVDDLALGFVAILVLDASAFEVAVLGTLNFLPFILFALPAGVWVDRLRRKPILVGGNFARAALLATIPIAYAADALTLWHLYVVVFLVGFCQVFFDVAYQSYLPAVVERDRLVEGNAKLELSTSASAVVGPGIAGAVVELVRAPFAIVFHAFAYAGAIVFLALIRRAEPPVPAHDPATGPRPSMLADARAGLGYVLRHPYLRNIAACTGTLNLFGNLGGVVFVLYLVDRLGITPGTLGLIFAVANLGVLLGALTAERWARWIGLGPTIVWSAFLSPFSLLLVAVAPAEAPIPFLVAGGVIGASTSVVYNVNQVSLRQAITPERMLGRMNATMRFIVWGTIPVGAIAGGVLGELIGLHATIWLGAIGSFIGFLPVFFSRVRGLERIPEAEA